MKLITIAWIIIKTFTLAAAWMLAWVTSLELGFDAFLTDDGIPNELINLPSFAALSIIVIRELFIQLKQERKAHLETIEKNTDRYVKVLDDLMALLKKIESP